MKKTCQHPLKRRFCEAGLYGIIAVKKQLLRKQNNVKRIQWAKAYKDWKTDQWNKVLWTNKSNFEIFRSNRRVYVWKRVVERAATPCITPTIKHGGGSVMVREAFANYKVRDLHQVKGKLNHTSNHSMQSHLEYGLWVKDLY